MDENTAFLVLGNAVLLARNEFSGHRLLLRRVCRWAKLSVDSLDSFEVKLKAQHLHQSLLWLNLPRWRIELSLSSSDFDDLNLAYPLLGRIRGLTVHVAVANCAVEDELRDEFVAPRVSPLYFFPALDSLMFDRCTVVSLLPLTALTALKTLTLYARVADVDLGPLSMVASLRELYIRDDGFADVSALSPLTALRELKIRSKGVTHVDALWNLTCLQVLDLSMTAVSNVEVLARFAALHTLSLSNTAVTNVDALQRLTALTNLDLSQSDVVDVSPLAALTKLQQLDLNVTKISDVKELTSLVSLNLLRISGTQITDLTMLDTLSKLRSLQVGGDEAQAMPCSLPLLHELDIPVDRSSALGDFLRFPSLRSLSLSLYYCAPSLDSLADLPTLRSLRLAFIGESVTSIPALSSLEALCCVISVPELLGPLPALKHLDATCVPEKAVRHLVASLTTLTSLSLTHSHITDVGFLCGLPALEVVDLSYNEVHDVSCLTALVGLRKLRLVRTNVSDVSMFPPSLCLEVSA